jgi:F0F1-type ATP synthase membrane subunit a
MLQVAIFILPTSFALLVCTLLQLLELFVSFLQALVFTLLAAQYFGDINEHMKQEKVCGI